MQEERQTKLSNEIIFNLFREYNVTDIKFLMSIINRLLTRYKALENAKVEENIDILEIGISIDFLKKYKGKKNLTLNEMLDITKKISSFGILVIEGDDYRRINVFKEITYNERYKSIKAIFNDSVMDYIVLINDNFTLIDLNEIKDLSSKYELGLYLLVQMFKKTGVILKSIDSLKKYFMMKCDNKILFNNLRIAALKLNDKFNYNIKIEYEKQGRKIDKVIIKFKKEV